MKLKVEQFRESMGMREMRITGFSDSELSELKSMSHEDATDTLVEILDSRNDGTGTRWACGYGIYGIWFDNDSAYMRIGKSCD